STRISEPEQTNSTLPTMPNKVPLACAALCRKISKKSHLWQKQICKLRETIYSQDRTLYH
ncbi:MAG: hypothetical protein ACI8RD_012011, partial [Bacillariaceae sp.]